MNSRPRYRRGTCRRQKGSAEEHRVERESADDGRAGQDQQGHFGGGVEAESEQHADRVHLPGGVDPLGVATQEPVHQSPGVELAFQFGVVVVAVAHLTENPEDRHQHDQVEQGDEVEEGAGHQGADDAGPVVQPGLSSCTCPLRARMPKFSSTARKKTTVEWPREKKYPT